jgi:glycosyltransferase involved in cell wall biosynthesis
MNIIHIILGKANPNRMNGVNKVVHYLSQAQTQIGNKVEVWGITNNIHNDSYTERIYSTRFFKQRKLRMIQIPELKSAISKINPDTIVHIHGGFIIEFYWISNILKKNNIPFVFTSHGSYNAVALQTSYRIKRLYFPLFDLPILKQAKSVHLIGQSEYDNLEKLHPGLNRCLVPNGQDLDTNFTKDFDNKKSMTFGFMGRITSFTKGLDILLEAWENFIHLKKGKAKLVIMGDGEDIDSLKKTCKEKRIDDSVVFTGSKFGTEKMDLLKQMDVFLHPSRNEGMPGAPLEAASIGIPLIVSKETNLSTYVDNYANGLTLKENNAKNLTEAMNTILMSFKNNSIQEMGHNSKKMILREFEWRIIAEKFNFIYSS